MHHFRRWLCLLACVALIVEGGLQGGHVDAQSTDNGLEEQSVNSFEFDPDRGVVRVTIDITLRNTTTDRTEDGVVKRMYFDGYFAAIPLGAENIVASRDGHILDGTLVSDPERPAFSTYRFALEPPLFSGESTTVRVTYDHHGAPPRDRVPWRVNEAYAGFAAFGIGDDGLVTLRISQPFGYEFDEFTDLTGFAASEPDAFGTITHTRTRLSDTDRITVGMSNDDRLASTLLDVGGIAIELRSWPDDPEWADFAAGRVEVGIPALEDLIGIAWPVAGTLGVRQTIEPKLYGYAGWFDADSNEIAVGEQLDSDTMYHELSHAWFNGSLSSERWLTEGLAQVYAAELERVGGDAAREPSEPDTDATVAFPLADWRPRERQREIEEYGYATSFWVVDALVDDVGFDRARDVIAALRDHTSPYAADSDGAQPAEDWQRVYDAFVEVGGSRTARDVFGTYVVDADGASLIERRDRAVVDVTGLAERGSPWVLPVGIRNGLELWHLDDVDDALTSAAAVLDRRDRLEVIERSVGIDEPDDAGEAYAAAPLRSGEGVDFAEPIALLDRSIGIGSEIESRLGDIAALAGTLGVSAPGLAALDGVSDFTTGLEAADAQVRVLRRIVEVTERLDAASGVAAMVGRWGSGVEHDVDTARAQFERGDNAAALSALDSVVQRLDDAARIGAIRLAIATGLLLALVVAVIVARRRFSRRAAT